jgi:hypothetical protein
MKSAYKIVWKSKTDDTHGWHTHQYEDNIEMNLRRHIIEGNPGFTWLKPRTWMIYVGMAEAGKMTAT